MAIYLGYSLLAAGTILFLIAWADKSGKSRPFLFVATMMVMGGLAILQFVGTETPSY